MAGVNLNEHEGQKDRELIPSGTRVLIKMNINPPESGCRSEMSPALTHKNDDVHYMNCEFEIIVGKHKGRKVFQNFTVAGGKKDSTGKSIAANISLDFLRSAWDAHKNLDPKDKSEAAVNARYVSDYADFHGMIFPVVIAIKEGDPGYNDKNEIYQVITPDKPEYKPLFDGQEVEPANIGIIKSKKKGSAAPGARATGTEPDWLKAKNQEVSAGQPAAGFTPPPANPVNSSEPEWLKKARAAG